MREMINVYRTKMDKLNAITRWLIGQRNEYFCYFVDTEQLFNNDISAIPAVSYPKRPSLIFEELYPMCFYDISRRIEDDSYILIDMRESFNYTPPVVTKAMEEGLLNNSMADQPSSSTDKEV